MQPVVSVGACSMGDDLIGLFEDVVGLGEALLDIAEAHLSALSPLS